MHESYHERIVLIFGTFTTRLYGVGLFVSVVSYEKTILIYNYELEKIAMSHVL